MMRLFVRSVGGLVAASSVLALAGSAVGATLQASYYFNDTLAAQEGGVVALTAIDPLGLSGFTDALVAGVNQRVYHFDGLNIPIEDQAGLSLDTTGLVASDDYSAEMVFRFADRENDWRRIIDVKNRSDDSGFYVDPGSKLDVFPLGAGSSNYVNGAFHHVVLTVAPDNTVKGYLDGVPEFAIITDVMNISVDNLMTLFVDNNLGGAFQTEWSAGDIALFRLYSGQLSDEDVTVLAGPFFPSPGWGLLAVGGAFAARRRR